MNPGFTHSVIGKAEEALPERALRRHQGPKFNSCHCLHSGVLYLFGPHGCENWLDDD
jgi:hypothetical protein